MNWDRESLVIMICLAIVAASLGFMVGLTADGGDIQAHLKYIEKDPASCSIKTHDAAKQYVDICSATFRERK